MSHFFLPAVWLLVITLLSLSSNVPAPPDFNLIGTDKLGHAFVYAVLVWLTARAWMRSAGKSVLTPGQMIMLVLGAGLYGILMEWGQLTLAPSRHFEYDDMLANGIGAVVGAVMVLIKRRSR